MDGGLDVGVEGFGNHNSPPSIVMVGSFGSGCTFVATEILEKQGYTRVSLSDIVKDEWRRLYCSEATSRSRLQELGSRMRLEQGHDILAAMVVRRILNDKGPFVVDSVRNPAEILYLRKCFPDLLD